MPHQKRRAAAVGKWHSACPEVRLYRSKVDGEKTLPPAGKLCNPCLRASRRPHGRGKTVTVAKGWGLVTNKEESMEITKRRLADIVPYAGNAKKHDKRQISNVAESIKQYGFVQPIVIDRDGVIVIGHCRALAAKKLGMEEVPCVCVDDLTSEQVNALRLVDNKSNESDWDFDMLADELPGLDLSAFDFDFSFPEMDESEIEEMTNEQREQEFRERMEGGELSDDDEDYQAFLEKFEAKKTTDDCYTPENIYNVAKRWSLKKYKLGNPPVVRPFYPGGNYKKENYPKGCVVIDNPPFSIISEICEWYTENGIAYFLFAPTLTLLGIMRGKANYVACGSGVVYENGASVNTSFVTNHSWS